MSPSVCDTPLAVEAQAILDPLAQWAHKCHAASVKLVKSGIEGRVARGFCDGVTSQHSWVILGDDCYDRSALIIDPTLWSYDESVDSIWFGTYGDGRHRPHGHGSIWAYGKPVSGGASPVSLTPTAPLSTEARMFLELLGPLDRQGWGVLARAPVEGWPAGEILAAMDDTEGLAALVPIDHLGMTTDRNPEGLYR